MIKVKINNYKILSGLSPTFLQHKFDEVIQLDSCQSKKFYFKLTKMSGRWHCSPRVTVIDCLEAEVGGKKMKVSEDWARRHNYTGASSMYANLAILAVTCVYYWSSGVSLGH